MSDKVFSIGDTPKTSNIMTEQERATLLLERSQQESDNLSAQQLILDDSNKVSFPGYPYLFEALGEKILVSIDVFKSGYECKVCKGMKRVTSHCECEDEGRPGLRYTEEQIEAFSREISEEVAHAREGMVCSNCKGDYPSFRVDELCSTCKGIGAMLILPETSKNLPTTGVIVSMGAIARTSCPWLKVGQRILFGPYAGSMIPTKAGILFKVLDASNAWAIVEGAEDMGQFDFILQDDLGV